MNGAIVAGGDGGSLVPDANAAARYLARLSAGSRPAQRTALATLAEIACGRPCDPRVYPWHKLDGTLTLALRSALVDRYKPNTAARHLAALRGVLREARRLRLMAEDDYRDAVDLPPPRGETLPAHRACSSAELGRLFGTLRADLTVRGARDLAIMAVLVAGGLRRHELVSLDRLDVMAGTCRVHGKGGREREQPLPPWACEDLASWLALSGPYVEPTGPVFMAVSRSGRYSPERLSTRAVALILEARATAAGMAHTSPHDLRHTYATTLLEQGNDLALVAALMGHAQVTTTQRYDRRGLEAKQRAAAALARPA